MTSSLMSRLRRLRRTKAYLMFASAHLMTVGVCAYGMFHGVLPYYLRQVHQHHYQILELNHTETFVEMNDTMKERIGTDIGVITGTGAGGQLLMSILAGYILKRFSLRLNWILGSLFYMISIMIAMFAEDVMTMCVSNVFVSSGYLWLYTTIYAYNAEFAKSQQEFNFLVGWTNMWNSVGFVVGYSAVSAAYQFYGRRKTFGVVVGLLMLDLIVRVLLPPMKASRAIEVTSPDDDDDDDDEIKASNADGREGDADNEYEDLGVKSMIVKWLRFLRNPMVMLLTMQTVVTYVVGSIMWSSAPNYLANYILAEQWQTGLIMGLGQGLGLLSILFMTVVTSSTPTRMVALLVFQVILSAACLAYPWTSTVWTALVPDVVFRGSRDALVTLVITLYNHVTSTQHVGDSRMAYSLFGVCVSTGMLAGYYGSGILVAMVTFKWLYTGMGVIMLLLCSTYIPYFTLQSRKDEKLSVSLKDIHNSCLTLPQVTLTRSRSNFGSGSLAGSRSQIAHSSLIKSKQDVGEDIS